MKTDVKAITTEIKKLELGPKDVLVVQIRDHWADEGMMRNLRDAFRKVLEKSGLTNQVAILSGDIDILKITEEQAQKLKPLPVDPELLKELPPEDEL